MLLLFDAGPSALATPVDSIRIAVRQGDQMELRTLPAGAFEMQAVSNGVLVSGTAFTPDAPRNLIVRFAAPPTATARRLGTALEASQAPYRRFLADLAGLEGAVRTELGERAAGIQLRRRLEVSFNGVAITASRAAADRIRKLPYVTGIFPDDSVHALLDQSVTQIRADSLRAVFGLAGSGIVVSIVDTGIDYTHPALGGCLGPGCRVIGGYDFVNGDANPLDDNGHGTHVAGIVGGNGAGLMGVAPGVRFLAYKVLSALGGGTQSDVIAGIDRSLDPDGNPLTDDAADVINLSIGGPGDADDPISQAVDHAVAAGVVCVVAAGNSGNYLTIGSPGCARRAITVGAVSVLDRIAAFSSRGPAAPDEAIKPDVVAPGVGIVSTWLHGGSQALSGTSMATPHVSGVAALLLELHPGWSPQSVKSALMNSAVDLGVDPFQQGAGRIDALAAGRAAVTFQPASLSVGLSPTATPVWAAIDTLTVRNDSTGARVVTLSVASNLPPGSSFQVSPASVALGPGETKNVVATLVLDHAPMVATPPYAYTGELRANVDNRTLRVPFAVLRTPQLVLRVDDAGLVIVHDRSSFNVPLFASGPGSMRLFVPAGTYDVMAALGAEYRVVREGIVVADSQSVDLYQSDAVHAVQRICIDEHGSPVSMPIGIEYMRHHDTGIGIVSFGGMPATMRFNSIGPAYDWEWHRLSYGQEPTTYDFKGFQRGVTASVVVRNAPGDLRHATLVYHARPGVRQLVPVRWVSDGPRGVKLGNGFAVSSIATTAPLPPLESPFTQEAYFMSTPDSNFHFKSSFFDGYPYQGGPYPAGAPDLETPYLIADPGQPVRGYLHGDNGHPVLTLAQDHLEIGYGPPTWFGSFHNLPATLQVSPQFGTAGWIFLTQQGDWRDHSQMPFQLAREGTLVETGSMTAGLTRQLIPGTHTLTLTNERCWIGGQPARATVAATFNSLAPDPDPPFMGDLSILVNGAPSDVATSGFTNLVRFMMEDAVALDSVALSSRALGTVAWNPLPLLRTGNRFEAALPTTRGGPLALRIDATDATGNRLTYSIEPAVVINSTLDNAAPSVTVTSPNGGESWASGSHHGITWTATDNVTVDSVAIQVSTDGGAHYNTIASGLANTGTYDWLVPGTIGNLMRVQVVARDPSGNTATDASNANFMIVEPDLVGNGGFESNTAGWSTFGSATLAQSNEGHTGTHALQVRGSSSSSFGCDDLPNWITKVATKGALYRISGWVKTPTTSRGSVRIRLFEYVGSSQQGSTANSNTAALSATWTLLTMDYTVRTAGGTLSMRVADAPAASGETFLVDDVSIKLVSGSPLPDAAPLVSAPASVSGSVGRPITFNVTASDPDGQAISRLEPSGLPPLATFTVNSPASATFSWTPVAADVSAQPYGVTFTASNTLPGQATTHIMVSTAPPNLCGNGDFQSGTNGWGTYGNAVLAAVPGGRSGNALQISGSSSFGTDDLPNWIPAPVTKSAVYRISCYVKGMGGAGGSAKIRVYEFLGSTQQGSTAYSQSSPLTPNWQPLEVDYTVRVQGTTLSIRITDAASSGTESVLVDDVVIEQLGTGALAAGENPQPAPGATPAVFAASFTPNPVRTAGTLSFTTTRAGFAQVDLLDVNGRHVQCLLAERTLVAGAHHLRVDWRGEGGRGLSAGLFFYRIRAGEGELEGRLVLLK